MPEEKVFLSHRTRRMKHEKRAPKNEAPSFHLADLIAGKLLLSRAYVLFKPARNSKKFSDQSHQLFLTTLPQKKTGLQLLKARLPFKVSIPLGIVFSQTGLPVRNW